MIPVSVHGAQGRMGVLITELVAGADDMQLAGLVTEPGGSATRGSFHPDLALIGQDEMSGALPSGGVIIDFSLAGALDGLLDQARTLKAPLVIGTTGFSRAQHEKLEDYAREFPVVHASNFSVGIPALQMLLQLLARTLPQGFDAEQVETHHVTKLDKPSGTARTLSEAYSDIRGGKPAPTHSQRLGGVIGEHTWTFSDQEETLVLTHRAHSRQAFLRGILPAVRFVAGRETGSSGIYGLVDVLKGMAGPR
ncbi:MAG: 4-hydroxy-tetrahydrodipicolinate reductase [Candidatus Krumholzibacteria bacterium]|nr:4-hydroxy-tetrahydrodipicolinate reductase [Candidatus Krumholzibacteria bacterium]